MDFVDIVLSYTVNKHDEKPEEATMVVAKEVPWRIATTLQRTLIQEWDKLLSWHSQGLTVYFVAKNGQIVPNGSKNCIENPLEYRATIRR